MKFEEVLPAFLKGRKIRRPDGPVQCDIVTNWKEFSWKNRPCFMPIDYSCEEWEFSPVHITREQLIEASKNVGFDHFLDMSNVASAIADRLGL